MNTNCYGDRYPMQFASLRICLMQIARMRICPTEVNGKLKNSRERSNRTAI